MKKLKGVSSSCGSVFVLLCLIIGSAQAQNGTTPANEVSALNAVWSQLRIPAPTRWNTSGGEPCSGAAVDGTNFDSNDYNPALSCQCNGTVCHITRLKIYAMDVTGSIPDELWTLTYLINLDIRQNYLTGPLSSSIGNLTNMQYMSIGINALSGPLPKELGQLTDLRSLAFGTNNFSGPLPSELGSLSKLEQLYFDSAGVSGPIPTTFAALQNLQVVWASDNALTGSIPSFIGSWSKLTVLRFQGNSFSGPIPATFSNLSSLSDLRISDLSNGSSSLAFLDNMTSLSSLILRNNNISDSIPLRIGNSSSLSQLDLSFNNLTGPIPASLFNLSSLSYLFLGNNKLNGTLPAQKSSSLLNIDLSYNQLSGSFPSWISQQNLQINLVANNFTIQSSNNSVLASGLDCLQTNFPCYRNAPIYSDFAVKCGGLEIESSSQITYERDNFTLGPATYGVSSSQRWGVSNVGRFGDSNTFQYTYSTTSQTTGTLDSELFQTARISPSSLRYYGLGLQNGNYTVTLQFAEIAIENSATWKSLGRRVFDIYIQGSLMDQDFDIRKAAGGASLRAVSKVYTAQVAENYLEIHLFWAGKGTCCVPGQGTYGPLISALSATPDFTPTVSNKAPGSNKSNTALIVGIVVPVAVLSLLSLFAVYWFVKIRKSTGNDEEDFLGMEARPYTFTYAELKSATNDFQTENKLGEGGFGPVYKGKLTDGRVVAVKQLSVASHQGKSQFVAEIATISAVQHRNLVKLYGCCIEGDKRLLVYEYLENKSLDQALFGNRSLSLDWLTRFDICLGVARGLTYLHEESRLRIVHRDVKASNILLDSDLNPKISDFGLAKLYDDKKTHISTRVAGTIGYLAPEYAMRGHLTEKADVFGFGVVALEIVAGRPNSDQSMDEEKIYLLEWAWNLHESNHEIDLVDNSLSEFDDEQVKRVIGIALLCTQTAPGLRPPMSRVVAMLSGDIEVSSVTSRPGYLTDWKFNDDTTSFMNSTDERKGFSHISSSTGMSMDVNAHSYDSEPQLEEIVGEGR